MTGQVNGNTLPWWTPQVQSPAPPGMDIFELRHAQERQKDPTTPSPSVRSVLTDPATGLLLLDLGPTPAPLARTKLARFVWSCRDAFDEGEGGVRSRVEHDVVVFEWDGVRNLADPRSVARARLHDALGRLSMRCNCGAHGWLRKEEIVPVVAYPTMLMGPIEKRPPAESLPIGTEFFETRDNELCGVYSVANNPAAGQHYWNGPYRLAFKPSVSTASTEPSADAPPAPAATDKTLVTTEPPTMNKPTSSKLADLTTAAKGEASDAAWRAGARQFVRLARDPLCAALARNLAPGDRRARAKIAAFFVTDAGEAVLSMLLGSMLLAAPQAAGEVPVRLSRELRVGAMAQGRTSSPRS